VEWRSLQHAGDFDRVSPIHAGKEITGCRPESDYRSPESDYRSNGARRTDGLLRFATKDFADTAALDAIVAALAASKLRWAARCRTAGGPSGVDRSI
jgi:hypothetical protein